MNATPDTDAQLARYRTYYAQDPDNHDILCRLIELEIRVGAFDAAQDHLREGDVRWDADPVLRFLQATLALARDHTDHAEEVLQALLSAGVNNPAIRYNLGCACLSNGKPERALSLFDSVEAHQGELPDLPLLRARTLHHLGRLDEAFACAAQYLETHPDSAEARGAMALLHLDLESLEAARALALKARALDPDNGDALLTLGWVALEDAEAAEALSCFSEATGKYPESGRAWSGIGLCYMMTHELEKARRALEKAVQYIPGHIGTWHALAWCQIAENDLDAAQASFDHANAVDRNFGETHGGLAVIAALRGDWEAVERKAAIALRLDPESFAGRFAQSLSLARQDPAAAQAMVDRMLASVPTRSGRSLRSLVSATAQKRSVC